MDTQRLIALMVFSFSGFLLWQSWQKYNHPPIAPTTMVAPTTKAGTADLPSSIVPTITPPAQAAVTETIVNSSGKKVAVQTDLFSIELNTLGGDIRQISLLKHVAHNNKNQNFILMQDKAGAYFVAQSGLLGQGLPNHTSVWTINNDKFDLGTKEKLDITFTNNDMPGIVVNKTYTFTRGKYVIDIRYDIKNETGNPIQASAYYQFLRDSNAPEGENASSNPFTGVVTFTGPAIYTEEKKFQKVTFADIDKNKHDYIKQANNGWIGLVQHYFVSAWLPQGSVSREFFTKKVTDKLYAAGVVMPVPENIAISLYVGPQEQENLKVLAPGLDLVVDYGIFKILAYPMFVILSWLQKLVGNWGWTIILFTVLIKLVFFPLNQKAGKSMAHMKELAPKIEAMKARYGDDRMKMNQAMMDLYRTEKINPMGGCLPILIQMPFFIALYWVLLGAVELRNAPWMGWIHDLSSPDPFYVLPLLMGATMIIQTKLNPAPPDPVQAKVMMIMPIIFSVMFFFFPAGLVLYWTISNILGIVQQWYINQTLEKAAKVRAAKR